MNDQKYEGHWLPIGTKLHKRYRIDDVTGEGGSGIVYLGYDQLLMRTVSIKEYFPGWFAMRSSDGHVIRSYNGKSRVNYQKGLDKFIEEARNLAKFENERNIVTIKDFFCENGTAYMVMEQIAG